MQKYSIDGGIITIGDNWSRKIVRDDIINQCPNFNFVNAIHPSVIIGSNAKLGRGVVAMAGCIINTNATIGDFCFFATGAQIEHDCTIDEYASVSAGAITGGMVHIGKFAAVTLGVIIVDRVAIGENSVIGSGALVTSDIPANVLAYGTPAKVIRTRNLGEKFLK
jgi:sugar O-acyltransferase (sialic acid O-acetyltransferase NeuD family)